MTSFEEKGKIPYNKKKHWIQQYEEERCGILGIRKKIELEMMIDQTPKQVATSA